MDQEHVILSCDLGTESGLPHGTAPMELVVPVFVHRIHWLSDHLSNHNRASIQFPAQSAHILRSLDPRTHPQQANKPVEEPSEFDRLSSVPTV